MTNPNDDAIETLLRRRFEGPAIDAGFSERVMQRLPPRRRRVAWPLWLGLLAGTVAGCLSLAGAPILDAGWRDGPTGGFSAQAWSLLLAAAVLTWMAVGWALAESEGG
ncbi:MAG: hypothetical protein J0L89_09145 [Xanthomonadales bacterium]|nr:hypothetical protein [Xanthomonadaceae bacterium]MBN8224967.1 hypothetical protein [Xanthomonadales bacterium]HRF83842.1 hypothetical protein [Pseudoxanthomonas sp.]